MRVSLIKFNHIYDFILPNKIEGNFWVTDEDKSGLPRNLLNIKAEDNSWFLYSNYDALIIEQKISIEKKELKINTFYIINIKEEGQCLLYCEPLVNSNLEFKIKKDCDLLIGSSDECNIYINNTIMESNQAKLFYRSGIWTIQSLGKVNNIYVNNMAISVKKLNYGDIIFISGLKLIVLKDYLVSNNPNNNLKYSMDFLELTKIEKQDLNQLNQYSEQKLELYKETDYFYRPPRFKRSIEHIEINIDPAPTKKEPDKTPAIYTIGPMLTMGMTSMVSAYSSINSVVNNNGKLSDALPSIILAGASLATMIFWPILQKKYQNRMIKKEERLRQKKYKEYIDSKRNYIKSVMDLQSQILRENNQSYDVLKMIIENKKPNLWERSIDHDDFLTFNIGEGTVPVDIKINYPEEHFSMEDDNLKDILNTLVNDSKDIIKAPIEMNFAKKFISAIVGPEFKIQKFVDGLMLQALAYHGFDDLKIAIFTSTEKEQNWNYIKNSPHIWSDNKEVRLFATNVDEMKQVSSYLDIEFQKRISLNKSNYEETTSYVKPYYLIIVDNYKMVRDVEIIKNILKEKNNNSFSIIILNKKLTDLPKECMNFICIPQGDNVEAGIFENELISTKQKTFLPLVDNSLELNRYTKILSNIPMEIAEAEKNLPNCVSFLEMYNVGTVEQLNILSRWERNNPIQSLQAPVGIDKYGQLFLLDLHEKFHGPHGLIAGMTGSGKSEFIITYILSMAINYRPEEVAFVLIDYKGGGLAGAFDNKETGVKLPHIAGTITNLDITEMKRSLASIESEIRRRQRLFNDARQKTNESTIDIYKYQKLYRNNIVEEAIPHLLIICDEFAELKVQQPEFMDDLISVARIGRSLGVHLVLATQKPSGVVNDQIWSNSRFRICLKVQERSDSMDMIKCEDAASLKQTGRFYLQVGYNEYFGIGQSAWCGANYIPSEKVKKKVDNSIEITDNTGYVIDKIDDSLKISDGNDYGEQIKNIMDYIIKTSKTKNSFARKLWLDKIPEEIYERDLSVKYNFIPNDNLEVIIGEYDDPNNQRQELLTYKLAEQGNLVITGIPGSGRSLLIEEIIYSAIINYTPKEVGFYILDFGAEVLNIFENAPHVGNIIKSVDGEKINNLFKLLNNELANRKKLLKEFSGEIKEYNKNNKAEPLPYIITIINNYEAFLELFEDYEDNLVSLSRDGHKAGIIFILSQISSNTIRYRLKQNFSNDLVLQLNDEYDYIDIVGKTNGLVPTKCVGRGLIKIDKSVYEFQTAYSYKSDKMSDYLEVISKELSKKFDYKFKKIPVLPEIINKNILSANYDLSSVPLGIYKENLNEATWNFINNYFTLISTLDIKNSLTQIINIINMVIELPLNSFIIDANKTFNNNIFNGRSTYVNSGFEELITKLVDSIDNVKKIYTDNNQDNSIFNNNKKICCIIFGIPNLLSKISSELKDRFLSAIIVANKFELFSFILVNFPDELADYIYEDWFKNCVNTSNSIWINTGLEDQELIKVNNYSEKYNNIEKGYGYLIFRGKPVMFKIVEEESNE